MLIAITMENVIQMEKAVIVLEDGEHAAMQLRKVHFVIMKNVQKKQLFFSLYSLVFLALIGFIFHVKNLGYIITGILKLVLACGCCGAWPLTYFGSELQNSESVKSKLRGVSTFFSLLAFAWWIVDWARILGNKFPDGNGTGLIPW